MSATPPVCGPLTFAFTDFEKVLHVPVGAKDNYSSAKAWTDYFIFIVEDSTMENTDVKNIAEKCGDVEYFTLNGKKIVQPSQSGIYIVKKGGETRKVVVKK